MNVQYLLLLSTFTVLVFWYCSFLWNRRKLYLYSWNVPGPFNFPFIGSAYKFLGNPDDVLHNIFQFHPSLTKLWLGPRLIYFLSDPDHVEKVVTNQKCLEKGFPYNFLIDIIGEGLLTAPVSIWRRHRKIIMPSFNQKVLDSFVDIFAEQAIVFTDVLKDYVGRTHIGISQAVSAFTFDVICETAMGLKMNCQRVHNTFLADLENVTKMIVLRAFRIWYHLDWIWRLSPLSKKMDKHVTGFRKVTSTVIKTKMEAKEEEMKNRRSSLVAQIEEGSSKKKIAFLDLILENSEFTEKELTDEVEIFLVAGTDTSATTICFLFEILAMFPEIQQKVYEEVIDILGEDRPVEPSDLPKFKYLERVVKETMRLFPVGVFFLRTIGEDIDLGKYILPEGATAIFNIVNIHRDPKYWPDPLKFDPDRFLSEEVAKRPPCAYIPFSFGPRGCIGAKYAMMNIKTVTAATIRKYKMFTKYKSVEEIELRMNIVLRPKFGYKAYLEYR